MTETKTPWTVEDVANRFAEAAWTAHRVPRVGPRGYFNPWMTTALMPNAVAWAGVAAMVAPVSAVVRAMARRLVMAVSSREIDQF